MRSASFYRTDLSEQKLFEARRKKAPSPMAYLHTSRWAHAPATKLSSYPSTSGGSRGAEIVRGEAQASRSADGVFAYVVVVREATTELSSYPSTFEGSRGAEIVRGEAQASRSADGVFAYVKVVREATTKLSSYPSTSEGSRGAEISIDEAQESALADGVFAYVEVGALSATKYSGISAREIRLHQTPS